MRLDAALNDRRSESFWRGQFFDWPLMVGCICVMILFVFALSRLESQPLLAYAAFALCVPMTLAIWYFQNLLFHWGRESSKLLTPSSPFVTTDKAEIYALLELRKQELAKYQ